MANVRVPVESCPTRQQIEPDHDQVVPVANVAKSRVIAGRLQVGATVGRELFAGSQQIL
jgi:hypothetical protein